MWKSHQSFLTKKQTLVKFNLTNLVTPCIFVQLPLVNSFVRYSFVLNCVRLHICLSIISLLKIPVLDVLRSFYSRQVSLRYQQFSVTKKI